MLGVSGYVTTGLGLKVCTVLLAAAYYILDRPSGRYMVILQCKLEVYSYVHAP